MFDKKAVEILNLVIKKGLYTYKQQHSKASLPELVKANKEDAKDIKGAVFAVRDKSHFLETKVKGYIITSKETLFEDYDKLTHWTPNVFRKFTYLDDKKHFVCGYEEQNLGQVNTFVIDIDTKAYAIADILMTCIDNSVGVPTFIVESDRGYQLYFVLEKALYISAKNDFRILKMAKRVSENLKRSLEMVEADYYCNDFGFFRMPTKNNVIHASMITYDFQELLSWSMRQDDDAERSLYVVPGGKVTNANLSEQDWFKALLDAKHIKGEKGGKIGRDNSMFTIALILMSEGKDKGTTYNLLDEYNSSLQHPLKNSAVKKIVKSAYSGRYKGAKKEYIEELLHEFTNSEYKPSKVIYKTKKWCHHKKERAERKRVHLHEWESDLVRLLEASETEKTEGFVCYTQNEVCELLKMPSSTLNKLLSTSTKILKKAGKGRNAKTAFTTVKLLLSYALEKSNRQRELFINYLKDILSTVLLSPAKLTIAKYVRALTHQKAFTVELIELENTS